MSQENNILKELSELNSSLAGRKIDHPYVVPAGYFENIANQALLSINDTDPVSEVLKGSKTQMPFLVPADYFETLSDKVLNRIKALNTADANDEPALLSPLLHAMPKEMPLSVPADYFNNDQQTAKEELETISPLIGSLKKKLPYSVPAAYFENITLPQHTAAAKVRPITKRNWFRIAAAAVITGIIALATVTIVSEAGKDEKTGAIAMSNFIPDIKIITATKDIDESLELIDMLDSGIYGTETAKQVSKVSADEIRELLKDVPEQELDALQEQTNDLEEVLMN